LIFFRCSWLGLSALLLALFCTLGIHAQTRHSLAAPAQAHAQPQPTSATSLTYCIDPDWAPYEAIRNHTHVGISAAYMKTISAISGIHFELVETKSWQQSLEFVQQGKCQMISMLNVSDFRKQFLDFSIPYFEAPNVLVAKTGTPILQGYAGIGNRTVGIVKGYRQVEYISRHYPELRLKLIESEQEGLRQLNQGEFDVMVGSLMSVNTHINNLKLSNLHIVGYAEPYDSLAFGVNKAFSELIPTLNDAILHISDAKKVEIYKQWNNVQVHYQRNYFKLLITAIIIVMITAWLVWRNRTLNRYRRLIEQKNSEIEALQTSLSDRNRTLDFLSAHDTLTGLYNRNHMLQKAEDEISRFRRFNTTSSLIVLEIDQIRDGRTNGYDANKREILKYVASQCLTIVREVDIVSRFSDDQFTILCPQTSLDAGKVLADRLVVCLKDDPVLQDGNRMVAVGLSELKESETFPDWFERTTKALLQSKRQGYGVVSVAD